MSALIVSSDAFFNIQLSELAARYAIPTIYDRRDFAAVGGLIAAK